MFTLIDLFTFAIASPPHFKSSIYFSSFLKLPIFCTSYQLKICMEVWVSRAASRRLMILYPLATRPSTQILHIHTTESMKRVYAYWRGVFQCISIQTHQPTPHTASFKERNEIISRLCTAKQNRWLNYSLETLHVSSKILLFIFAFVVSWLCWAWLTETIVDKEEKKEGRSGNKIWWNWYRLQPDHERPTRNLYNDTIYSYFSCIQTDRRKQHTKTHRIVGSLWICSLHTEQRKILNTKWKMKMKITWKRATAKILIAFDCRNVWNTRTHDCWFLFKF